MNEKEIGEFFDELRLRYPKLEISEGLINFWASRFTEYEYKDVKENFNSLIETGNYDYSYPQLEVILKGLIKKHNKVDFSKMVVYCRHCRRPFNNIDDCHKHEDRCSAIRYIESKYEKYNWEFTNQKKAELYKMNDEEFDKKYNDFLKKIQEITDLKWEKEIIENIFNPQKNINQKLV